MRGPGLRVKNDVRRIWRCPACLQQRRLPASIVAMTCACRQPNPQMQLVEGRRAVRIEQPPLPPYIDFEELLGEDPPAAQKPSPDHPVEVQHPLAETTDSLASGGEAEPDNEPTLRSPVTDPPAPAAGVETDADL